MVGEEYWVVQSRRYENEMHRVETARVCECVWYFPHIAVWQAFLVRLSFSDSFSSLIMLKCAHLPAVGEAALTTTHSSVFYIRSIHCITELHWDKWDKQLCTFTLTPMDNLQSPINITWMFLDCARKREHLKKTHAGSCWPPHKHTVMHLLMKWDKATLVKR